MLFFEFLIYEKMQNYEHCVQCSQKLSNYCYEVTIKTRFINLKHPQKSDTKFESSSGILCGKCLHHKMQPIDRGIRHKYACGNGGQK